LQYELTSPLGDISCSCSQTGHLGNAIMNYHEIDMFLYKMILYWKKKILLLFLFRADYPTYSKKVTTEKQDLKELRGSQTSQGVSDQEEARFCDTLQDV
jgi:hypothetical protein